MKGRRDVSAEMLRGAQELGYEARISGRDHAALKLWLRMLSCTTQIETEIRHRLRARFEISLPRFDYMAQLYRHRDGLRMKALSQCLMVTGGNVTALTDELQRDELVQRDGDPVDRRSWLVRLTPKGRDAFEAMAHEHEGWVLELFASLDRATLDHLHQTLGALRVHLVQRHEPEA